MIMMFAAQFLFFLHARALKWDGLPYYQHGADIVEITVGPLWDVDGARREELIRRREGQLIRESRIGSIPIFQVDTRSSDEEVPAYGASMEDTITNIGAAGSWHGMSTKTCAIRDKANDLMSKGIRTPVIFVDGGDVLYGGCGESEFASRYNMTVDNCGGAELIFGAELHLWPNNVHVNEHYESISGRWKSVLSAANLNESSYSKYIGCSGPCSTPRFLNSGFVMGPPSLIHAAYEDACNHLLQTRGNSEQLWLHPFFIAHQKTTCLDYSNNLMLNLYKIKPKALRQLFEVDRGKLWNTVASKYQCFVHGSGDGKAKIEEIAHQL